MFEPTSILSFRFKFSFLRKFISFVCSFFCFLNFSIFFSRFLSFSKISSFVSVLIGWIENTSSLDAYCILASFSGEFSLDLQKFMFSIFFSNLLVWDKRALSPSGSCSPIDILLGLDVGLLLLLHIED